jgi:hypothetical protein
MMNTELLDASVARYLGITSKLLLYGFGDWGGGCLNVICEHLKAHSA